ncbi:hypothetical protein [Streptomyces sindenensis]|uniref:hypothetical protein n=1 Tax=Streptomyces sindenensis TaxID=67363 RepID=UPI0027E3F134|nr:hypothetical protein [Streptomyces sindenensis]
MSDHESRAGGPPQTEIPKSRLAEYAEMSDIKRESGGWGSAARAVPDVSASELRTVATQPGAVPRGAAPADDPVVVQRRLEFTALLERFRAAPVLAPMGEGQASDDERGLLTADMNGIRFILAFSDQQALARYAQARGEFSREWTYQTILGARLLDVAVPAAGVPCGVALDCADGPDGLVLPPVKGIVPDGAAIDANTHE